MSISFRITVLAVGLFYGSLLSAEEPDGAIDSSVVATAVNTSGLKTKTGGVVFESALSGKLPRILGSDDPLRGIQYLPWVNVCSEQDAGIRINGCEDSHNLVDVNGIPVYGARHLFGLFSLFQASHFGKLELYRHSTKGNWLGGELSAVPKSATVGKLGGQLNVGLVEADGTMEIPVSNIGSIYVSARKSFLNLLYGKVLTIEGTPFRYGLADVNVSGNFNVGAKDKLQADFYWGRDDLSCSVYPTGVGIADNWGNVLGGVSWAHSFSDAELCQQVYASKFFSDASLSISGEILDMPSSILDAGYKGKITTGSGLSAGLDVSYFRTAPQRHSVSSSVGSSVFIEQTHTFCHWLGMTAVLKGELFKNSDCTKPFFGFSPSLDFEFRIPQAGRILLGMGISHQYLFRTGVSDISLPLEFWISSGSLSAPQRAAGISLDYEIDLFEGKWSLSSGAYFKSLNNQIGYYGELLTLLSDKYRLEDHLLHGDGRNYGADIMLRKNNGKLTGWISYTYSRATRRFSPNGILKEYPSSHERPHELKALASYRLGRWNFSGTFLLASGTPYTPVRSFYIISNQIISQFAEYNSGRLSPYIRLDLSVNFYLNDAATRGFNLSLYNVTCHRNALTYRVTTIEEEGSISYWPISWSFLCLPSVSYFHKF